MVVSKSRKKVSGAGFGYNEADTRMTVMLWHVEQAAGRCWFGKGRVVARLRLFLTRALRKMITAYPDMSCQKRNETNWFDDLCCYNRLRN